MAKSKEQKKAEAQKRNQHTYFYSTFLNWLHWMPGGRFLAYPVEPMQIDLLVRRTQTMMRAAEEAGLNFDHDNQVPSMEYWTAYQVIEYFMNETHMVHNLEAYCDQFNRLERVLFDKQPLTGKDWSYNPSLNEQVLPLIKAHRDKETGI